MRFILASGSPRRKMLLAQIGIKAEVRPSSYQEEIGLAGGSASELVARNARGKGEAVLATCLPEEVVIAADTVVVLGEEILGKPHNAEAAIRMLRALSGQEHRVLTGLAVFYRGQVQTATVSTLVRFRQLTTAEIRGYVATGEPLDKAGAYGIQGRGAVLVESICGCYNNVVGLPLTEFYLLCQQLEVKLP